MLTAESQSIPNKVTSFPVNKFASRFAFLLICFFLASNAPKADAQAIAPTGGQAAAIFGTLIGVGVGAGVGIYFLARAPHNVTGCVTSEDANLQLTDGNGTKYLLSGEIASLKPQQRIRVHGKPGKNSKKQKTFTVEKLSRDFGACATSPSAAGAGGN
jgi:hypothetical protein